MTPKRACVCGAVDCQRHGSGAWRRKPAGNRGGYGAAYQHNREILLRRVGCRPGTGVGGTCEICGKPGVPGDPLLSSRSDEATTKPPGVVLS